MKKHIVYVSVMVTAFNATAKGEDITAANVDPRIEGARRHHTMIVVAERTLANYAQPPVASNELSRVRELLVKMRPDSFSDRAQFLDEFKRVLAVKRQAAPQLRQRRAEANEAMQNYLQALAQAPAAFRAAAEAFEQKSAKEKLELYQRKQKELAVLVRELAANFEKQFQEAADFSNQFHEAWDHLDGQLNYLESLDEVVALMPNPRDAAFSEKLRAEVDSFLKDATEMDQAFKKFTDSLLKKAVTDAPATYLDEGKSKSQANSSISAQRSTAVDRRPQTLLVEEPWRDYGAVDAQGRLAVGETLSVIRGKTVIGKAKVLIVSPRSTLIGHVDGRHFAAGDVVELPARSQPSAAAHARR